MLSALAKRKRMSRSDVVREAIGHYGAAEEDVETPDGPYAAWVDVIGVVSLGARDPKRTTGEQFVALVADQTRARRSR
jgi:metal-responsive CopG/Arc/MetJ family transcriptional regulator